MSSQTSVFQVGGSKGGVGKSFFSFTLVDYRLKGSVTDVPIHVCRNLYFGEARRFDMYNSSKAREAVEKNGMTLDFPAVGNRVPDWLYSRRMSIRAALPEIPLAHARNCNAGGECA